MYALGRALRQPIVDPLAESYALWRELECYAAAVAAEERRQNAAARRKQGRRGAGR